MTECKLNSGVNQQGALKQNGVKGTTMKRGWANRGNSNFCSEIHTEHTHSLCGQKAELFEC